jgi:small multidrug resistance pump
MAWLLLAVAIASEVLATTALKLSDGMTRGGWTAVVVIGYIASFVLLARALKMNLPVGISYAVWAGIGLIIVGVAMLNLTGAQE